MCVGGLTVSCLAARGQLPEHQAHGVHVYPEEGVPLEVDGPLEHLRSHVAPRPHLDKHRRAREGRGYTSMHASVLKRVYSANRL